MRGSYPKGILTLLLIAVLPVLPNLAGAESREDGSNPADQKSGTEVAGFPVIGPLPKLDEALEAQMPIELRQLNIIDPQARVRVSLDQEGQVYEVMCLWATHHALVARAEETVRNFDFIPFFAPDEPRRRTGELTVFFYDPEQVAMRQMGSIKPVYGDHVGEAVEAKFYRASPDRFVYEKSQPDDLDDLLVVTGGRLVVVQDLEGNRASGDCLVEFYVDQDGKIRFPKILSSDSEAVSKSALLSLKTFVFEPPRHRNGIPTYVRVRQPIGFD